jgi:hypothetical protein
VILVDNAQFGCEERGAGNMATRLNETGICLKENAIDKNMYDAAPANPISDILLQFSRENFYFGCTFWTFQNKRWLVVFGSAKPQGKAHCR